MKKYNVKIRSIKENEITVLATCKNEALSKVADGQATKLIIPANLQDIATFGTTIGEVMRDKK